MYLFSAESTVRAKSSSTVSAKKIAPPQKNYTKLWQFLATEINVVFAIGRSLSLAKQLIYERQLRTESV
jgi:hypothetical protein